MWITGNDAVNRYDGNFVKVYNKDIYFENCKNLQQAYGIVEDNHQNIYFGSTYGLYVYLRKKDKFIAKFLLPNSKDQTVFPIGFSDGKIWCHNKDFDIISYDIKTEKSKIYPTSNEYKVSSFHVYDNRENQQFTRVPFIDNDNNIWIINPEELLFFDTKTQKTTRFLEKYFIENQLNIYTSCYDKFTNCILIGTNQSLLVFNCTTKIVEEKLKNTKIASIAINKDVIAMRNGDVFEIYSKDFRNIYIQRLDENFATSYSFSFDKMERLWVCRDGFGQIILDFNPPF